MLFLERLRIDRISFSGLVSLARILDMFQLRCALLSPSVICYRSFGRGLQR